LYDVLERAGRIGARHHEDLARTQLRALGMRPRRAARKGVDALTPSERVVAGLAADGLTTGAIAERLTLSPHTIETHLRHVYRKLDIAGRHSLASSLAESSGT
jgi:DNA-binding CsgD family transcriptional regulator